MVLSLPQVSSSGHQRVKTTSFSDSAVDDGDTIVMKRRGFIDYKKQQRILVQGETKYGAARH
jgi:hypothetical protein